MKIILTFSDMNPEAEDCLVGWIEEIIKDKTPKNSSPLRYADKVEIDRE